MTDQPSPDQTGTWEPDWISLGWKIMNLKRATWSDQAKAVVSAYRRQQAANGFVEVSTEGLKKLVYHNNYGPVEQNEARMRLWKALKRQEGDLVTALEQD